MDSAIKNSFLNHEYKRHYHYDRFKKGDSQLIKELNQVRILNLIRHEGPISRIELARRTKISKVAISEIINRLSEAGYILEVGKGKSTRRGGKRPTLLKLNPDNGYVVGIEVKRSSSQIAIANLESTIIDTRKISYEPGAPIETVLPMFFKHIDGIMEKNHLDFQKLISIGIGIPGLIDYQKGTLLYADTLHQWVGFPLAEKFSERYSVPTILENDVNTITLGETLLGSGREELDLVLVWIGEGIGAGIVVNGQLIQGIRGGAGEIGYLEIGDFLKDTSRIRNLYDNQKIFGELLSELTLTRKLHQVTSSKQDLTLLLKKGDEGDPQIQQILSEYAYPIYLLCMHLIKTINPNALIISGRVISHSNYLYREIKQLIEETARTTPFTVSRVLKGELNETACLKGAIAVALQTLYEPPLTDNLSHVRYLS